MMIMDRAFGVALGVALLVNTTVFAAFSYQQTEVMIPVPPVLSLTLGKTFHTIEKTERTSHTITNVPTTTAAPAQEIKKATIAAKPEAQATAPQKVKKRFEISVKDKEPEKVSRSSLSKQEEIALAALDIGKKATVSDAEDVSKALQGDALVVTSYEKQLALWFQENQYYPDEAKSQHLEGSAVVRIEIDVNGNILHVEFAQRTGNTMLDRAVSIMVEKANPVPPLPSNYPYQTGEKLEFYIPIRFTLS